MSELLACFGLALLVKVITTVTEPVPIPPNTVDDNSWKQFVHAHWGEIGP
jgi:hypothetical protein